jgi:acetyltransferase-like isoleucine patch superfamily enzyme
MKRVIAALVKYCTNNIIRFIPLYAIHHGWYRKVLGWTIGPGTSILMGQHVEMAGIRSSGKQVIIGKDSVINQGCLLYTTGGLIIGEHVRISSGMWLVTGSHDINDPQFPVLYKPIIIQDYVWIGMRATILAGVTIGEGSVVMAGAVVTQDVSSYMVVGGVPARVIRERQLYDPADTLNFRPLFE